jgi:hypothetical protein
MLRMMARVWRALVAEPPLAAGARPAGEAAVDARREASLASSWIGDAATARSRTSETRARRLLTRLLSDSQLRELEKHGCFTVRVPGRGTFCILPRSTFNVIHLQTGNLYCCTTEAFVPLSDLMLAQKLLLENDPDRFFAAANCRPETFAGPQEQQLRRVLSDGYREEGTARSIW